MFLLFCYSGGVVSISQFLVFVDLVGSTAANTERLGIGEIRDLINLEMPQLNDALVSNKTNTQVPTIVSTCFSQFAKKNTK